ncbi:MAG: hypothetical protein H0W25_20710 [Acidimicrobiia bacterium]|nr:hypothetical protein [Acidimicrobiia bacterium]
MSKIGNLLQRITEPALRADLTEAVAEIRSRRSFGLVFESHLPETVRLPHHPVRRGTKVAHRVPSVAGVFHVMSVDTGVARLIADVDDVEVEEVEAAVEDLVVVADFGDPIYPGLRHLGSVKRGGDKPSHIVINGC